MPDDDDDLSLLLRWLDGDASAGRELFRRYFNEVYRFFERKVGGDADDLVQRTFMAIVSSREQFRRKSSFRTYLFAIARNELYTYWRQLMGREHLNFEEMSIGAMATSVGTRLERAREIEVLHAALRQLSAEQQLLLELHYWHDLDAAALTEVFEVPPGTIRVRLSRARDALRALLAEHGASAFAALVGARVADSAAGS